MKKNAFPYDLDFDKTDFRKHPELYRIGVGEQGVLLVQPYKNEILPSWKFKTEENLNFTLLSDFNKDVSRSYKAIYENFNYGMKGVSKRAAFIIDRKGLLQYIQVLENAGDQPNFNLIVRKLAELV